MYAMLLTSIRPSVFLYRLTALDTVLRSRTAAFRGQRSNKEKFTWPMAQ